MKKINTIKTIKKSFIYQLIILIIILFQTICYASESKKMIWISIGGGKTLKAFSDNHSGLSFGLIGNREYGKNLISFQMISNFEFRYLGYMPSPIESINHIGILYSKYKKEKDYLISAGIGPSWVNFIERGKLIQDDWISASIYEKKVSHTVGLLINAQVILIANSVFGIGFHPYININTKQMYCGVICGLQIGNFRLK